jgi:nucleotide-binding universal stress UspA family protein
MIVQDMLVHLKSHEEWSPHIDYALDLAAKFGARLRGEMTFSDIAFLRSIAGSDDTAIRNQQSRDQKVARSMRDHFAAAASAKGVECEFLVAEGQASELVTRAARLHDLTIIEQHDPKRDEFGFDPAEEAVLSAGRPVLVVPAIGRFEALPKHILIAWNGSPQAATALHFALPFIARAARATVCVGDSREKLRSSASEPDLNIAAYLSGRIASVDVEAVKVRSDEVGEYLLKRATECGAGMMVMGAYGRSRFSEVILGGATRHILQNMTLPVLMGR